MTTENDYLKALTEEERLYITERLRRDPDSLDIAIIKRLGGEVVRLRDTPSNNDKFYMKGHSDGMAQSEARIKKIEADYLGLEAYALKKLDRVVDLEFSNERNKKGLAWLREDRLKAIRLAGHWARMLEKSEAENAELRVEISKLNHTIGRLSLRMENKTKFNEGG